MLHGPQEHRAQDPVTAEHDRRTGRPERYWRDMDDATWDARVMENLAADGMSMVLVTHEMAFARKVSDRVIFMHQGRVHETGAPAELFGNPQTPELQQFLSSLHD